MWRSRGLAALLTAATALTAVPALADNFDFVAVVDESGSMNSYQRFIGSYMGSLDASLVNAGSTGNRFGLTGYSYSGATNALVRTLNVGSGLFGTSGEFLTASQQLRLFGGTEDGYAAMNYSLGQQGQHFASGARRNFVLVTDEDRDIVDTSIDRASMLARLRQNNIVLTAVINIRMVAPDGSPLLAIAKNSEGTVVGFKSDGNGGVTTTTFGSFQSVGDTTQQDYAELALDTGGVVSDLSYISQGGASAAALATALTQALLTVNTEVSDLTSARLQESAIESTAQQVIRSNVRTIVSTIGNRLRSLRENGSYRAANADGGNAAVLPLSGLSGGNGANAIGMWVDYTYGNLRGYGDSNRYKGHTNTVFVGADYAVTPQVVLGLAVGYDQAHLSSSSTNNLRMTRGASATLYGGYLVTDWLQASVQATLSRLDNDIEQTTLAGTVADGGSRSDRYVLGAALSAFKSYDALTLTGTVGYNRAREGFDSYTSSDGAQVSPGATRLGQIQLGGEAAYNLEKGQAYVSATWEWDVVRSDDGDRNGAVLGAGFRYSAMENLELGLAATAQVARRDERQFTLGANIRYAF